MRYAAFASLLAVLSFTATSQGQEKDTFDSLARAIVKELSKVADALASITDKKTAEAAKPKLIEVGKTMQDLHARVEKLGKPSKEEEQAIKKYQEEALKIASRIQAESVRVLDIDGAAAVLKELDAVFKKKKKEDKK
jgi:hypothetical protein